MSANLFWDTNVVALCPLIMCPPIISAFNAPQLIFCQGCALFVEGTHNNNLCQRKINTILGTRLLHATNPVGFGPPKAAPHSPRGGSHGWQGWEFSAHQLDDPEHDFLDRIQGDRGTIPLLLTYSHQWCTLQIVHFIQ